MAIQLEDFVAGRWEKAPGYRYFIPTLINDQWKWTNPEINTLLESASRKLGELNSFARIVHNINLFMQLHITKEAVVSSRIEGTKTNIDEALLPEEEIKPERRDDWIEVKNYTKALNSAIKELEVLPLSSRLLRNTHKILLQGVRGETKQPGNFRKSQNWIGGNSLADAIFIPPADHYVPDLMSDLEKFLHNQDIKVPLLIRIGIAHYQFETIHPFLDGNGRIGRLMIPLFLVNEKVLDKPLLYLSAFFEKNKGIYYDNLMNVRTKNSMIHWLKYFLVGIIQISEEAVNTLSKILTLKSDLKQTVQTEFGRRTNSALKLLNHLFEDPVVDVKKVERVCNLSFKSANDLVSNFEEKNILNEITGQSRNRIFLFKSYIDLFK